LTTHFHEEEQEIQNLAFQWNWLSLVEKTALGSFQTESIEFIDLVSNVSLHKQIRVPRLSGAWGF